MILVTGAGSYVGRFVVAELLRKRQRICGHFKSSQQAEHAFVQYAGQMHTSWGDLADGETFERAPRDVTRILHLAAQSPPASSCDLTTSNPLATSFLTQHAKTLNVETFVFLSGISAFGEVLSANCVSTETGSFRPGVYGASKLLSEEIIRDADLPSVMLRLPGVVGPHSTGNWLSDTFSLLNKNKPIEIYAPDSRFNNVVHINDLSKFLVRILCHPVESTSVVPVGTQDSLTVMEVVRFMQAEMSSTSTINIVESNKGAFYIDATRAFELGYPKVELRAVLKQFIVENAV